MKTMLCLGDSYTIGEGVPLHESFPYQCIQILRNEKLELTAPEVIAKTGWTTFELKDQLAHTVLLDKYDFVTLLIGVNNQYRGLSSEEYRTDFQFLLSKALKCANDKARRVVVLSIPHWGFTPFAEGRDTGQIEREIDAYNEINRMIGAEAGVHYIDIAPGTKLVSTDIELLTADKLHYSAKEYKRWAQLVADVIRKKLS